MDKKRRITNIIGIVVLGTIIIGVTTQRGIQYLQERERIKNAESNTLMMADDLAKALVFDSSGDLVMKWARNDGEYVDVWGNPFIIEFNSKDYGAQIRSIGADGELYSDDDILSRVYKYEKVELKTKPAEGKMQEIKDRLERTVEDVKNSEAEVEKEKGWKFNFRWGKKKDE